MVNRHSRIPAILILVASIGLGYAYLRKARADARPAGGLEALEAKIQSGKADKKDWLDYAAALNDAKKYGQAAQAYKKVLELEPYHRQAKFEVALALANAGDKDGLAHFLRDLVYAEAKLAVDLFERREMKPYLEDPQFQGLQKEARAQAMD
jgi:hypothetical protein